MSRLSAGAGYQYLLRDTCCGDTHRAADASLTSYYTASGNPPGVWYGTGLIGLGYDATGRRVGRIRPGAIVTEDAMSRVYGAGRDPITSRPLGAAYRQYRTPTERIKTAITRLPASLTREERDAAVARVEAVETARRTPVAVAGFDLTFTVPKSVSVLWGLADPRTQARVVAAHRAAVTEALELIGSRALYTRVGRDGTAQVATRGMVAAGFEHPDTRAGDPNLHTHVVIANRVQTARDGVWRTLDSRALHHAAVAVSEYYDDLIADKLTTTLGVGWGWRDRGPRRCPAHEITGIDDALLGEFSTRSRDITTATQDAISDFTERRGRYPTRAETTRLRQQATLATRPVKRVRSLRDLIVTWRQRATRRTGLSPDELVALSLGHTPTGGHDDDATPTSVATASLTAASPWAMTRDGNVRSMTPPFVRGRPDDGKRITGVPWLPSSGSGRRRDDASPVPLFRSGSRVGSTVTAATNPSGGGRPGPLWRVPVMRARQVPEVVVARLADEVITRTMERRSTWTRWNLLAEAGRVTRGLRLTTARDRLRLLDRVTDTALSRCLSLDAPEVFTVPADYQRPDGVSVFTRDGETRWTTTVLLDAETRLLAGLDDHTAPVVPAATATRIATTPHTPSAGTTGVAAVRLHEDQVQAVIAIATSPARLQVLVGPAGTGKTTTLRALRHAWEAAHGHGSVLGLASSATAAGELSHALGIGCENTTKWLYESTGPGAARRTALITHTADDGSSGAAGRAGRSAAARWRRAQERWRMRPGQLVIVDEASLAGTLHLDQLFTQARAAGAKLLLVGDHQQLSSVDAGGAFRLLASTPGARELTSLWRFRRRWEATASRRLRAGDPTVIDTYTAHDRIQAGPGEVMVEAAYRGWTTAETAGRSALLLAPDARTVAVLNARAHDDHVATGAVTGPYTPIADGVQVGVGDRVVTRANDRRLRTSEGGFVRNGDLWHITAVHPDGALTLVPAGHYQPRTTPHAPAVSVVVPGEYVRANVELGYASTIHRAQGITVEQALVLLTPGMGRQGLYVAMTRGRALNRVYVATDVPDPDCDTPPDPGRDQTPVEILTRVLANDTAERAATQVLRDAQDHAGSLARLVPIRDSLLADADTRRWTRALPTAGLTPDQVRHVQASPAAGALYTALRKVEADGHNPVRVLRGVLAARPTADADDLASVLHQRVTDWHQDQPPPQQTADPASRALRALRVTPAPIDRADPAGPVLAEIDDAIRNRIQNLTLEQVDVRPAWMAPLGEPPTDNPDDTARWRQAVATLAAYRDLHQLADTQPVDTGADPGTRDRIGDQQHRLARHAQRTATRLGRHGPTRTPDRSPTR